MSVKIEVVEGVAVITITDAVDKAIENQLRIIERKIARRNKMKEDKP